MTAPLILTLAMNQETEDFFDTLRRQHFPPELNFLKAHLTLFHHLPQKHELLPGLKTACEAYRPMNLAVTGVVHIGRGVAYKIESEALQQLHKQLQQQWKQWLIPQDLQKLWPHVTIQNKATPDGSRALQQKLQSAFVPFAAEATGLRLWKYLGGPWEPEETFLFKKL